MPIDFEDLVPEANRSRDISSSVGVLDFEDLVPVADAATAVAEKPLVPTVEQPPEIFDPEGTGYDYESAKAAGLRPDETGHWPSRSPQTGQILKGQKHPTYNLTIEGEKEAGYEIYKGEDGRYYSQLKTIQTTPLRTVPQQMSTPERLGKKYLNELILSDIEKGRPSSAVARGMPALERTFKGFEEAGIPPSEEMTFLDYINPVLYGKAAWQMLKGFYAPKSRQEQEQSHQALKQYRGAWEFSVPLAETTGEKVTDVAAGLSAFITRIIAAKKVLPSTLVEYPNIQSALAFELVNTDDLPGMGLATSGVLRSMGQIPASTITGKAGRLSLQSLVFGGVTALRGGSKEDIAIASMIPVAMSMVAVTQNKISDVKLINQFRAKFPFMRDVSWKNSLKFAKATREAYQIKQEKGLSPEQWSKRVDQWSKNNAKDLDVFLTEAATAFQKGMPKPKGLIGEKPKPEAPVAPKPPAEPIIPKGKIPVTKAVKPLVKPTVQPPAGEKQGVKPEKGVIVPPKPTEAKPEAKVADLSKRADVAFKQNDLDAMRAIVQESWELPETPEAKALVRRIQILDGEMVARAREQAAPAAEKPAKEAAITKVTEELLAEATKAPQPTSISKFKRPTQPWEMTLEEFAETYQITENVLQGKTKRDIPRLRQLHIKTIQRALREKERSGYEGWDVPRNVLEEYKSEKWAQEALAKPELIDLGPAPKAPKVKAVKENKHEEETITEPITSLEVEPRPTEKIVPTGKLDPTKPEDAKEIIEKHKDSGGGVGGVFEEKYNKETNLWEMTEIEYTSKQVDTAYRTVQKSIPSPMADVELFAMPGKEKQLEAIAQKMQKVTGRPKARRKPARLPKAPQLPKAKTSKEDHIKAIYIATAKEQTRYGITGVKVEGDTIITTDGRRLFYAKGKWGKDGLYLDATSLKKGSLGKADKTGLTFPKWRDIVPDVSGEKPIYVNAEAMWYHVRRAWNMTTEESRGITVIANKDGSLGFAAAAPEVGHVEINIHDEPGGRILGGVNPQYLLDAIKFHAIRGNDSFEFYFPHWDRPILTKSFDGKTNTVTMPINVEAGKPSEAIRRAMGERPATTETKDFIDHIDNPQMKPGFATVPIPSSVQRTARRAGQRAKIAAENIEADIDKFRFYPKAPPEFRNAVRIDLIGAMTKATKNVYENGRRVIWGDMKDVDIKKSVEIIYAKDQLSRAKLGKGNPEISIEQAQKILDEAIEKASPEAIAATNRWKLIHDKYTDKLIERGVLEEGQQIEDHVRHYVEDYTPEWAPTFGIPARLKRPFRGYGKKAIGTTKEYRQDQEALLASLMEMEHHNLVEDFVETQVKKYDIKPKLSREQRIKLFGQDKRGYAKVPRPGRIYIVDGKRYRAYTPDIPFSRAIYLTEDGEAVLGSFKNVALIPEDIYNLFRDFSQRGSRAVYLLNRATGYWKTMAILAHYPSFNVNNFVGDTWIAMVQHPKPLELLAEYNTAMNYILQDIKKATRTGYMKQLEDFITKHDIKQTFTEAELRIGRKARNPIAWLLRKSYRFSDHRESINRVAYGSSLLRAMQRGEGVKMVEAHDWIDTDGLSTEDALGKISRETLTDYQDVSKPFRRYVRGGIFPFGTWYFKTSARVWKWFGKHPLKAMLAFMALPLAALGYNRRRKEIIELEQQLPDYIRGRTHFILGENDDGTIRVLSLQLPQDVLIGTKIFSIVVDHSNRVINGEMTPREAAIETLKVWGIREYEGMKYLITPWIRMYSGLKTGRDPYDKAPVYRRDYGKMTWDEKAKDIAAYILKTSVPFLGYSIQTYEKGLPQDVAIRKMFDTLAGKGAIGIYDVDKKGQLVLEKDGKKTTYEWKDIYKIRKLTAQEYKYLGQLEDGFVASGLKPKEYLSSPKARQSLLKIYNVWSKRIPELKKVEGEDERIKIVVSALGNRITNRIATPRILQKWYQVRRSRAKTMAEKRQIAKDYAEVKKLRLMEVYKTLPKSAREIELVKKIKEMD